MKKLIIACALAACVLCGCQAVEEPTTSYPGEISDTQEQRIEEIMEDGYTYEYAVVKIMPFEKSDEQAIEICNENGYEIYE